MKKITGKVVSLVLALALVVTSFSANFAFASTKSVSGTVDFDGEDTIYLVNGGTSLETATGLLAWTIPSLDTKDHQDVSGEEISAVSHVSGDKLVKWKVDDGDTKLTLRNSDSEGKEVLSILVKGTYTNDDGDEVTVKASKQFTVYAYDKDAAVIRMYDDNVTEGQAPDEVDTFARNHSSAKEISIYKMASNGATGSEATWETFYKPVINRQASSADNAFLAAYDTNAITSTTYTDYRFIYSDNSRVVLEPSTTNVDKAVTATVTSSDNSPVAGVTLVPTGKVTLTAKALKYASSQLSTSSSSDDKTTLKTEIAKKVIAPADYVNVGKKSGTYLYKNAVDDADHIDVANAEVVFGEDVASSTTRDGITVDAAPSVTVSEGKVGKISGKVTKLTVTDATTGDIDLDAGDVEVSDEDAKTGDITTDGTTGKVDVSAGRVGDIDTTDADDDAVEVTGGTTGQISSDSTVSVIPSDEDTPAVTGDITAKTVTVDTNDGKVSVGTIKATSDDSEITLTSGDYSLSAKGFDFDHYAAALTLDEFSGKVTAPVNAEDGSISYTTDEDDEIVTTVTGNLDIDSITTDEHATLSFDGNVEVGDVSANGAIKVYAGKLYVTGSADGTLRLADATLTPGMTVMKADSDAMDEDDFDCVGFTLAKTSGSSIDTFKIASTNFGGIVIDKTNKNVAIGQKEVFTAVAYPTGTTAPTGSQISWDFSGSSDVFDVTYSGNTATVTVLKTDTTFASENVGTLTATLQDADGYDLDDYPVATTSVTAIATPEATSDTTKDFSVAKGSAYQFKITSATAPTFTTGTAGVFSVALASVNGNEYFYKITAIGNVGASTGIYLNGNKLLVATVSAPAFTTDTTKDVTVKGAYTLKVTAAATPTFALGTAGVFKAEFVSKTGNDYLYKITSVGAVGAKTGVYVNGVKTFVATVG